LLRLLTAACGTSLHIALQNPTPNSRALGTISPASKAAARTHASAASFVSILCQLSRGRWRRAVLQTDNASICARRFSVGHQERVDGRRRFEICFYNTNGWSLKGEYLYTDLGEVSFASNTQGYTGSHFENLKIQIVRVGLNYKLGNYYAPVVTK
jgi:hypothetical protein